MEQRRVEHRAQRVGVLALGAAGLLLVLVWIRWWVVGCCCCLLEGGEGEGSFGGELDEGMDGWMNGWMDGWMEWMDG